MLKNFANKKISRSLKFWFQFFIFKYLLSRKIKDQIIFNNDFIGNYITVFGCYEREMLDSIFLFLKKLKNKFKNGICLDVGSNIGNHSIYFSKIFNKVYGFEPNPKTFSINLINTKNIENITTHQIGLGDRNETKNIYTADSDLGTSSFLLKKSKNLLITKVKIKKLDDLKLNMSNLMMIKVDIEGFESFFFKGAKKIIKKKLPIIIFEHSNKKSSTDKKNIIKYLEELGYIFFEYLEGIEKQSFVKNNFIGRRVYNIYELFVGRATCIRQISSINNKNYPLIIAIPNKHISSVVKI